MKILGIDFGSRRVGFAIADTETGMAFPKAVYSNDKFLLGEIKDMCKNYNVEKIVIGESKDFQGKDNIIMAEIRRFKKMLEIDLGVEVDYELEYMTSAQAIRGQEETTMLDASSATIILQSYLDRIKN